MGGALSRIPLDAFLLLLVGVVVLAALVPARGAAADVLSVATKAAVALLFALYGARLSPQQALHGVRRWKLHTLVLATTFVVFPLLGLGARVLVPAVLTPDLYTGLLFLCLVPSTVQSSIAFTSIARGHVSAAIVSASLSNILGVLLTPLLAVTLMPISGTPHVDGSAVLDIVLQLLLPFAVGQALRPWLAPWVARHARLTHAVDRGDAIVLLFCGSKKSLASGLPMALVLFPPSSVGLIMLPLMLFHQIQLFVCAVIASRLAHD